MSDPEDSARVIADRVPAVVDLEPGTYWWCQCGRSETQPFCDGAHKGTDFRPVAVEIEEARRVALCQCKHTAGEPFCDGRHKDLD